MPVQSWDVDENKGTSSKDKGEIPWGGAAGSVEAVKGRFVNSLVNKIS